MHLRSLTREEASELTTATLGVPDELELESVPAIAESLRRAASFMCPTPPGRIVDALLGALRPLVADRVERGKVSKVLDLLVASGDLLELSEGGGHGSRLLYLAPPSYVERAPGSYLLAGVRPYGEALVPSDLAGVIRPAGHMRVLEMPAGDAPQALDSAGVREVPADNWISAPRAEAPETSVARYSQPLESAPMAGDLTEIRILAKETDVTYYSGRWRSPIPQDTGTFLARRPQQYGADLWCIMSVEAGTPQRVLDLPVHDPLVPGRDEAWRFQAALDSLAGAPQRFRIHDDSATNGVVLDFFSPLPGFAERYLELVGKSRDKSRGALFSFDVPPYAVERTEAFLIEMLWMIPEEATNGD